MEDEDLFCLVSMYTRFHLSHPWIL